MALESDFSCDDADSSRARVPSLVVWGVWGLLFVAGSLLATGLWFQKAVPGARILSAYLESECAVLDKHVERVKAHDYNPGRSDLSNDYEDPREFGYSPSVRIRYFVKGTKYEAWTFDGGAGHFSDRQAAEAAIADFVPEQSYPCWYDPDDPSRVVIKRLASYRQNNVGVVAAGLLGLLGLSGLLYCTVRTWPAVFGR